MDHLPSDDMCSAGFDAVVRPLSELTRTGVNPDPKDLWEFLWVILWVKLWVVRLAFADMGATMGPSQTR